MAHLPTEVLDKIFEDLPLPQKQECMFVCKNWAQVILSRSIFHTINIDKKNVYESVIAFFNTPSPRNRLIKHLEIHNFSPILHDTGLFFRLFPNLKTIKLTSKEYPMRTQGLQLLEQEPRNSQLEVVEDHFDCIFTRYLIQNNMCNNLLSLTLNNLARIPANSIFPTVMNMPVLRVLKISGSIISYEDIENIHANLPLLTEFKLADIDISSDIIPTNITPANFVTDFSGNPPEIARYALAKYPNLVHMNISPRSPYPSLYYSDDDEWEDYYNNNLRPLLQRLGPSLRSLTLIRPECYPHVFEELDRFGCEIESLTIEMIRENGETMELLVQSGQRESIRKLTVNPNVEIFQYLREMVGLEQLTLIHPEGVNDEFDLSDNTVYIDLNELCENLPISCESLIIKGGCFKYRRNADNTYNIRVLKLDSVHLLSCRIDKFISKYLPNLHSLSIINRTDVDYYYIYHLPHHHFSLLEVGFTNDIRDFGIIFFASNRNGCVYTTSSPKVPRGYSKLERYRLPKDVSQGVKYTRSILITLTCASVKTLVLNGVEAYQVTDRELFKSFYDEFSQEWYYGV